MGPPTGQASTLSSLTFGSLVCSAHARIQVGGDRVFYWTPHTSKRWGNVLSPYWQARALAQLAGHVSIPSACAVHLNIHTMAAAHDSHSVCLSQLCMALSQLPTAGWPGCISTQLAAMPQRVDTHAVHWMCLPNCNSGVPRKGLYPLPLVLGASHTMHMCIAGV